MWPTWGPRVNCLLWAGAECECRHSDHQRRGVSAGRGGDWACIRASSTRGHRDRGNQCELLPISDFQQVPHRVKLMHSAFNTFSWIQIDMDIRMHNVHPYQQSRTLLTTSPVDTWRLHRPLHLGSHRNWSVGGAGQKCQLLTSRTRVINASWWSDVITSRGKYQLSS